MTNSRGLQLWLLARLFVKLGFTAFGGPAAHIAMMREEVVVRRQWLSDERFLDLLAAANVIPGPTSTELAIHLGFERGRWLGLLVAGVSFIVPAMLLTGLMGWLYVTHGTTPELSGVLYGIKPVMVVVVLQALRVLAPKAMRTATQRWLGAAAFAALLFGVDELTVLFAAGALAAAASSARRSSNGGRPPGNATAGGMLGLLPQQASAAGAAGAAGSLAAAGSIAGGLASSSALFGAFFKIGSVLFGSGYVLLAFVRADLVERLGWLTEAQLLDAIAVGQVTPGPVFTTATFVGYLLDGPSGALAATAGIFLPAFLFVGLVGPLVPRLRRYATTAALLDGVTAASMALMLHVTLHLARSACCDAYTIAIAALALVASMRWRAGSTWLIAAGAAIGWGLQVTGLAP
ncbi:MAG: chromate efflux transporter [Planctomycetota bacterium]